MLGRARKPRRQAPIDIDRECVPVTRRSLLIAASLAWVLPAYARGLARGTFTHGVASGDPLPNRVIIWTRFVPASEGRIGWEVADDEAFARVVASGDAAARAANDFCVKVDVTGLAPGRAYYYRFLCASSQSPTGFTRTAPLGRVDSLRLALFSCANYPAGYFHAYGHAARRADVDLVLHVGDYIYEFPRGESANSELPQRVPDPSGETLTLADYHRRYACYHTDPDLLELRRLKPLSVLWDDHEFANDAWRHGAANHDENTEGRFLDRVHAARKAWYDWMPIRKPAGQAARIYRSLDWGDLARIVLLDARLIGRDLPVGYSDLAARLSTRLGDAASLSAVAGELARSVNDPRRSVLGRAQNAWLNKTLAESKLRGQPWQVIAQQVVVGDLLVPAGFTSLLKEAIPHSGRRARMSLAEQFAAYGWSLKPESWPGYPAARAHLLQSCTDNAANALVLSGDSHHCWVNNLRAPDGRRLAAVELAGGSVSSLGLEIDLREDLEPRQCERMFEAANPNLVYCDLARRGYGAVTLTPRNCTAEWIAFDDVRVATPGRTHVTRFDSTASAAAGPGVWALAGG